MAETPSRIKLHQAPFRFHQSVKTFNSRVFYACPKNARRKCCESVLILEIVGLSPKHQNVIRISIL
jgi:hypothetical protein